VAETQSHSVAGGGAITSAPVGITVKFRQKPPEPLSVAIDRVFSLGGSIAEVSYRFPFQGGHRRISELSGRETREVIEQFGRLERVSFHGPIGNIFLTNVEVREAVTHSLRLGVQEAALIGAGVMVLHLEPIFPNLEFRETELKRTAELLRDLAEYGACYGVKIGLETEYPYTVRDYLALIDEVAHPYFGATLDVGHLWDRRVPYHSYISREELAGAGGIAAYNALLLELAAALLSRGKLFHTHLHQHRLEAALAEDWPYGSCDHWALEEGIIDIPAYFRLLRRHGYSGLAICELSRGKGGPQVGSITDEEIAASLALAKKWWLEAAPL